MPWNRQSNQLVVAKATWQRGIKGGTLSIGWGALKLLKLMLL